MHRLSPLGISVDNAAEGRAWKTLVAAATAQAWLPHLEDAWPNLGPVFAASPYLYGLARKNPDQLRRALTSDPTVSLEEILEATRSAGNMKFKQGESALRSLKAEIHLLTALLDLGGVWSLVDVTMALSRFADAALESAINIIALEERTAGRIQFVGENFSAAMPGFFCIALGKHGAFELNYSSDIDITFFYDPHRLASITDADSATYSVAFAEKVVSLLQKRTVDGYVFRVDLRLRPDPSSTPIAMSINAAHVYYETVGQNWERAALIKARAVGGDRKAGVDFLAALAPFIWRRNLDYSAIEDIKAIIGQIRESRVSQSRGTHSVDLKLGPGGIREIEFFAQTQQLILGGRNRALRSPRTLEAISALVGAGYLDRQVADELTSAYCTLRAWEHRIQMVADEHTHRVPSDSFARRRIAFLSGCINLREFDRSVVRVMKSVRKCCNKVLGEIDSAHSNFPRMIFTGSEDDLETLDNLSRLGFTSADSISKRIRSWLHGHIGATRSERGRELMTRLIPRLLEACGATGAPELAFGRFAMFFEGLKMGVHVQALLLSQPRLLELIVRVMAFAPRVAHTLARQPAAMDALLDPNFFSPVAASVDEESPLDRQDSFEAAMDDARRLHREKAFQISVRVIAGAASAAETGRAFSGLADALTRRLSRAAQTEVERKLGQFGGEMAVIALGKCGSREMNARSDLDLMTLYRCNQKDLSDSPKEIESDIFCTRFTQRLVAALSAPTGEGELYEVDLKLRPSGTKGPVAVRFSAFENYYERDAEIWELLALTRARVLWATTQEFGTEASAAIETALRRGRNNSQAATDVREMRALVKQEHPPAHFWDMKLSDGGLIDIEFVAQYLQIANGGNGGPLCQNTGEALLQLTEHGLGPLTLMTKLYDAWELQQNLSQLLKVALEAGADPDDEPPTFRAMLAKAGNAPNYSRLRGKLAAARDIAHDAFESLV